MLSKWIFTENPSRYQFEGPNLLKEDATKQTTESTIKLDSYMCINIWWWWTSLHPNLQCRSKIVQLIDRCNKLSLVKLILSIYRDICNIVIYVSCNEINFEKKKKNKKTKEEKENNVMMVKLERSNKLCYFLFHVFTYEIGQGLRSNLHWEESVTLTFPRTNS